MCYSPFSPLLVAGFQRPPGRYIPSPGCAEAVHTRQCGVGLLDSASCSPDVAQEPPSIHRAVVAVSFILTKTETHPNLQKLMPQSQRTMTVVQKNARRHHKEISHHLFLPANITVLQRKGNV